MKPRFRNRLLFAALPWFAANDLSAQSGPPILREPPPLGLPRMKSDVGAGRGPRVPVTVSKLPLAKYSVEDLSSAGVPGASKGTRNHTDYLALDAGKEWSRTLRGGANDVTFVSFHVCASKNTLIEAGGARLALGAGQTAGFLRLGYEELTGDVVKVRSLGVLVNPVPHGGKALASLPMLTIRLDPESGVWDVFSGSRLLADNLPLLAATRESKKFTLRAGDQGAWISGLVTADENPLYDDVNANGIDDVFERKQRVRLLPPNASTAERKRLAEEWREFQRGRPPPPLIFNRPLPDGLLTTGRM